MAWTKTNQIGSGASMKDNLKIIYYKLTGRKPWSRGYSEYKWRSIKRAVVNNPFNEKFELPLYYGVGLDERIIEYPWVLKQIKSNAEKILDAGSTFNFSEIVSLEKLQNKDLTIFNFNEEKNNFASSKITYVYGDLRKNPFSNESFDEIVCISTIEHIGMDNSIYGHEQKNGHTEVNKSYDYVEAIEELVRVLKVKGQLLLTFPFGMFKNYGFFQQFDEEMVLRMERIFEKSGQSDVYHFKYSFNGWQRSGAAACKDMTSYNPHTGEDKGTDGAAHSRSICCIRFTKSE
jgi:SAM-dependent methyltransferase